MVRQQDNRVSNSGGGHNLTFVGQRNILIEFLASHSATEITTAFIITCPVEMAALLTCVAHTSSEVESMGAIPFESVIL